MRQNEFIFTSEQITEVKKENYHRGFAAGILTAIVVVVIVFIILANIYIKANGY